MLNRILLSLGVACFCSFQASGFEGLRISIKAGALPFKVYTVPIARSHMCLEALSIKPCGVRVSNLPAPPCLNMHICICIYIYRYRLYMGASNVAPGPSTVAFVSRCVPRFFRFLFFFLSSPVAHSVLMREPGQKRAKRYYCGTYFVGLCPASV